MQGLLFLKKSGICSAREISDRKMRYFDKKCIPRARTAKIVVLMTTIIFRDIITFSYKGFVKRLML